MGILRQQIEIGDTAGTRFQSIEAVVDTGASYTVVPSSILTELGIRPHKRMGFRLADESRVEKDVGEAVIRVQGIQATSIVVFADEGGPILLGVVALETLGLAVDPLGQRLIPTDGLLVGLRLS